MNLAAVQLLSNKQHTHTQKAGTMPVQHEPKTDIFHAIVMDTLNEMKTFCLLNMDV